MALRVVSLVPSLTETLLAWGVVPIACTRFCEQPSILHVGGTKDPDVDAIVGLAPDLVLMDREENRREDADALRAAGVAVYATHVTSLGDVGTMVREVRAVLDLPAQPSPSRAAPGGAGTLSAFIAIWRRPWMTCNANTYGSSLLTSIGVGNVFADHEATYPTITLDDIAVSRPNLVLLPSEPYPFKDRHIAEISAAVPDATVRLIDGQDLFWWGARTEAAAERLAQAIFAEP